MNETLLNLEKRYSLGPTFVAKLLGIAYVTYAAYRSGAREFPVGRQVTVDLLMILTPAQRTQFTKERIHVTRKRS